MSEPNSYTDIIRSSSLIGGAKGVSMLIGLARTKITAVLIGPLGVGLVGTYQALLMMFATFSGLGLAAAAMREMANASAEGEPGEVARLARSVRRFCWISGSLGGLLLVALAPVLSRYTFDDQAHQFEVALLGIAVLLGNVNAGQRAILQGLRRIGDLARYEILIVTFGLLLAVAFYSWLGIRGILPVFIASGFVQVGVGMTLVRSARLEPVRVDWRESVRHWGGIMPLALSVMWTALMVTLVAWLVRVLISQQLSIEDVGLFVAAFALAGILTDFVLGAMSADYQPRLAQRASDHAALGRLVNEQIEMGLLIALPGLLLTLAVAPFAVRLIYTPEFLPAVPALQWFVLGCMGRFVSWPLGFVPAAMKKARLHAVLQTSYQMIHIGMILVGLRYFGLQGVAVAFVLQYVITSLISHQVLRRLIGFHWSARTMRLIGASTLVLLACFVAARMLDPLLMLVGGLLYTAVAGVLSLREITRRLGRDHAYVQKALQVPGLRWVCGL